MIQFSEEQCIDVTCANGGISKCSWRRATNESVIAILIRDYEVKIGIQRVYLPSEVARRWQPYMPIAATERVDGNRTAIDARKRTVFLSAITRQCEVDIMWHRLCGRWQQA